MQTISGIIRVPPDKSIAQRAVILAAVAAGSTSLLNYPTSGDPDSTLRAVSQLGGIETERQGASVVVHSPGIEDLSEADDVLDLGNSGTGMRLLLGVLTGAPRQDMMHVLTGDESLRRRPMGRVCEPLRMMGGRIWTRSQGRAPIAVSGSTLRGGEFQLPVASAQVKSALLLAGLSAKESTLVREPHPSRDHSELMLKAMGASLSKPDRHTTMLAPGPLQGGTIEIPGDFSGAAFMVAAACMLPGSEVTIEEVGLNPTRTGMLDVLRRMGASVDVKVGKHVAGEAIGSIRASGGPLEAAEICGSEIPLLIDELPILALLAAQAKGITRIKDAGELRYKESDRLHAIAELLQGLGVDVTELEDGLEIKGRGGEPFRPARAHFSAARDHRMAMTIGIAELASSSPLELDGREWADVSFPGFFELLGRLRQGT